MVRRPAPTVVGARTTAGERAGHDIGVLTARFKTFREAARFAPPSERETWERRRDIAFAEMQIARFRNKLDRYQEREKNPRPEQVQALKNTLAMWRGRFAELTGQV
jgi:antibiotic biosynthesis monooxygenase (ABM) superfamily enzyme